MLPVLANNRFPAKTATGSLVVNRFDLLLDIRVLYFVESPLGNMMEKVAVCLVRCGKEISRKTILRLENSRPRQNLCPRQRPGQSVAKRYFPVGETV